MKISDIFSKLAGGRGISSSEAKVMYIKKACIALAILDPLSVTNHLQPG